MTSETRTHTCSETMEIGWSAGCGGKARSAAAASLVCPDLQHTRIISLEVKQAAVVDKCGVVAIGHVGFASDVMVMTPAAKVATYEGRVPEEST